MRKLLAPETAAKIGTVLGACRAALPMIFNDACALTGACFIVKGISLIYVPAGWISGGIILIGSVFVRELTRRSVKQ